MLFQHPQAARRGLAALLQLPCHQILALRQGKVPVLPQPWHKGLRGHSLEGCSHPCSLPWSFGHPGRSLCATGKEIFSPNISETGTAPEAAWTAPAGARTLWARQEFPRSSWRKQHQYLPLKSTEASFKLQSKCPVSAPRVSSAKRSRHSPGAADAVAASQPRQLGLLRCS